MRFAHLIPMLLAALLVCSAGGCARAARDTTGFAVHNEVTVGQPFDITWQAVKEVLREQEYDIHTRDKRGTFVAYGKESRAWRINKRREEHVIAVEPVGDEASLVTIDSVRQVYGATVLTYPGWHDRKLTDSSDAQELLAAIQAKADAAPAETTDTAADADAS
jgi:hypothetical protein